MAIAQADPAIFVPELDDDYSRLMSLGESEILKRIHAYFLLGPSLLVHPAYAFQSQFVNTLVFDDLKELLRPPHVQATVGDSEGWNDYLRQRIHRLEKLAREQSVLTEELLQYQHWGDDLFLQAKRIDRSFPDESLWRMKESRDRKFRRFLRADLLSPVSSDSFGGQISSHRSRADLGFDPDETARRVAKHVKNSELVSMETFLSNVRQEGLSGLADEPEFRRRLLNIYYRANVDDQHIVPGLAGLEEDQIVDPYDAEVFWAVFGRLFGQEPSKYLSVAVTPELIRVLRGLKDNVDWEAFRLTYIELMTSIENALRENLDVIVGELARETGSADKAILSRFWRRERVWICLELVSTIVTGIGAGVGGLLLGAGAAVAVETARARPVLRRFIDEYKDLGVVRLKELIGRKVRIAIATRNSH